MNWLLVVVYLTTYGIVNLEDLKLIHIQIQTALQSNYYSLTKKKRKCSNELLDPSNGRTFGSMVDQKPRQEPSKVFSKRNFISATLNTCHDGQRAVMIVGKWWKVSDDEEISRKLCSRSLRSWRRDRFARLSWFLEKAVGPIKWRSPFLFVSPANSRSSPQISSSTINVVNFFRSVLETTISNAFFLFTGF